jgi:hypothetical protein
VPLHGPMQVNADARQILVSQSQLLKRNIPLGVPQGGALGPGLFRFETTDGRGLPGCGNVNKSTGASIEVNRIVNINGFGFT